MYATQIRSQLTLHMLISTPSKMMTSQISREARRVGGNTSMITTRAALVVGVQGIHSGRTGGHASSSTPERDQIPAPGAAGDVSWLCWGAVVCCEANPPVVGNKTKKFCFIDNRFIDNGPQAQRWGLSHEAMMAADQPLPNKSRSAIRAVVEANETIATFQRHARAPAKNVLAELTNPTPLFERRSRPASHMAYGVVHPPNGIVNASIA